jgi:hypothetical protein
MMNVQTNKTGSCELANYAIITDIQLAFAHKKQPKVS